METVASIWNHRVQLGATNIMDSKEDEWWSIVRSKWQTITGRVVEKKSAILWSHHEKGRSQFGKRHWLYSWQQKQRSTSTLVAQRRHWLDGTITWRVAAGSSGSETFILPPRFATANKASTSSHMATTPAHDSQNQIIEPSDGWCSNFPIVGYPCVVITVQTVSLSTAILSRLLPGYRSLMPSCAGFLEPKKSRIRPPKSMFNAENFIRSLSMSISIDFGAVRFQNVSCSPKLPKNP